MLTVIEDFYTTPYCVYGHYVDGVLIYIGSGGLGRPTNIDARRPEHIAALASGETKCVIFARFADLIDAREHEALLIKTCKPMMNYMHAQGERTKQFARSRDTRPIKCIETGISYFSAAHAASVIGISHSLLCDHLIGDKNSAGGMTFKRVEWSESGLDKDERWSAPSVTRRSERMTARQMVILDEITTRIMEGEPSPKNEELAVIAECATTNVTAVLHTLEKRGYISIENAGTPDRLFHINRDRSIPSAHKRVKSSRKQRRESRQIVDALARAAEAGDPCPSNADLAAITGSQPSQPGKIISRLKKKGVLRVEMVAKNRRVIHINDHSTAPTADHNVKGVATVERTTRSRDYIIV